jgi:flagellar biosynthetic protein FliR
VEDVSYSYDEGLIPLALIGLKETITGIIIGFMLNFVFQGISYAGTLIGFDMGIAMARAFDPTSESETNVIGQALLIMSYLIFLIINGHHYIIRAMAVSFDVIPIGFYTINESLFNLIVKYSAGIFVLAVKIASPIMVSFFLIHLGSGIIARVIPQMNVFFVLHPVKMILGFLLLISVTPIYVYFIKNLLSGYENKLLELIRVMST